MHRVQTLNEMNTASDTKAHQRHSILLCTSDQTTVAREREREGGASARHTCQGKAISGAVHRSSGSCWIRGV